MKKFLRFTENNLKSITIFAFLIVNLSSFAQTETRLPDGDIAAGAWVTAPLWSKINAIGGSTINSTTTTSTGEVTIQNPTNAGSYTGISLRFDARKSGSGGATRGFDANIRINGTLLTAQTVVASLGATTVTYNVSWTGLNFTQSEINSLQVVFTGTGSGNNRDVVIDFLQATLTYCPTPATPTSVTANASTICTGSSSNLNATSAGNTIRWYTVASGGTNIGTSASGANFSVSPTSTTTYFAEALSSGGCASSTRTPVVVTVNPTNTAGLPSSTPTLCQDIALTNITHTTTGATGIGSPTGLPAGVTAAWAANTITISGTPTASGTFNYTIPLTGGCGSVNATGTITVNPIPTSVLALEGATTICIGNTVNLTASANSNSALTTVVSLLNENFNSPTNNWTTTNTSTGGTPANAAWTLRPDNYLAIRSNDQTQFYMSDSDAQGTGSNTLTTLTSPSFSTVGLASASLSFHHYYRFNGTESAVVEVSTDGTSFTPVQTYTSTQGVAIGFQASPIVIDLASYLGQPTVFVRFRYTASFDWYWAIDNVSVSGISSTPPPPTYAWTSTPSGFTSSLQNPTSLPQTVNTFYTVTATNSYGCSASDITNLVSVSNTNTWVGTSTSWNNASNWSCGYVPSTSSDVVISTASNYPEISSDVTINSLTLDSGTTLKVNSNYDFSVTDIIDNDGTLTFENNANLIQVNNVNNIGSGSTVVKRNSSAIKRLDYTIWSSPVTGQGLYAFSKFTLPNRFYIYNTATNLFTNSVGFNLTGLQYPSPLVAPLGVNGTDSNNVQFVTGKGYLIRMPWDHPTAATVWNGTFTGVPNNGNYNLTLVDGGAGSRFNLVGNPYPSPIDAVAFVTNANNATSITGTLYFWRKTNNALSPTYCTWSLGGFVSNGEAQVFDPNDVIQTGQGFFVEGTGSGTVNFNNAMRVDNHANQFFRNSSLPSSASTTSMERNRIWLNATNSTGLFSQTMVGYMTNATQDVDAAIDGRYINDGDIAFTSLINEVPYAIQGRALPFEPTDVVPMSFKVATAGVYSIAIDHVDGLFADGSQAIILKDNLTNTTHNLQTGSYSFNSDAGTFASRFEIIYQASLGVGTPVFNPNHVIIYQNEIKDFVIKTGDIVMSGVKVFDVRGRLILAKNEVNDSQITINVGQTNGVLLIQITSQEGLVVTKKVIR